MKYAQSTIMHVDSPESMRAFDHLCKKWPGWRISVDEHRYIDLTECEFIGNGGHELVAFTFARHLRLAALTGESIFPVWFAVGAHWSDRWHDADGAPYDHVPLLGIVRGIRDKAAFVEPLRVLLVASCTNGQFVYDETIARIDGIERTDTENTMSGNPRFRKMVIPVSRLANAVRAALALPCPAIEPADPRYDAPLVSITVDEALEWDESRRSLRELDCPTFGKPGSFVVYAYAFVSAVRIARLESAPSYPVKIGYTAVRPEHRSACQAAMLRILLQVDFPEPLCLLGLLTCENGRSTEKQIHAEFKDRRVLCLAREWFATNSG